MKEKNKQTKENLDMRRKMPLEEQPRPEKMNDRMLNSWQRVQGASPNLQSDAENR